MGGYNSGFSSPQFEQAIAAALLQEKSSYNITQDKGQNYASLAEAIAAVSDEKYKVNGLVLTFYTGTEWVSKRYNGADASGFATEDNWVDAGGGLNEKIDWVPLNTIVGTILSTQPDTISESDYNTLKSFLKEPDKFYYPSLSFLNEDVGVLYFANSYRVWLDSTSNDIGIFYTANVMTASYCFVVRIPESREITYQLFDITISASSNGLSISASNSDNNQSKNIFIETSGDGTKFLSNNGQYKEISAGTQYLDLSMFASESGTLSDEDYQKIIKAHEDKVTIGLMDGITIPIIITNANESSLNIFVTQVNNLSDIIISCLTIIVNNDKSYTANTESMIRISTIGEGTKALTDNGQYAEFIPEAPKDGKAYVRKNGAWVDITTITG